MKKIIFLSLAILFGLSLVVPAFAHDGVDHGYGDLSQATRSPSASRSPTAKPSIKPEDVRQAVKDRQAAIEDKIEEKREDLEERLASFRDQQKAKLVERINQQISALNERLTNHFANVLDKLSRILERIIDRAENAGLDSNTSFSDAVEAAQGAIDEAKEAVTEQAEKVYEIKITDEGKVRVDVGGTRDEFRQDIKGVFDLVKAAQKAVRDVAIVLGGLLPEVSPSVSPSLSPTP